MLSASLHAMRLEYHRHWRSEGEGRSQLTAFISPDLSGDSALKKPPACSTLRLTLDWGLGNRARAQMAHGENYLRP